MSFIARRIGFFLVTLWAALTFNFFLPRLMPGNPGTGHAEPLRVAGGILAPSPSIRSR